MSTLPAKMADMQMLPSLEAFTKRYKAGEAQVVWTRIVADLETPVSVYLKLAQGRAFSFLLESVEGGASRGRYSVIGLEPDLVWRANGDTAEINHSPLKKPKKFVRENKPTLESLRSLIADSKLSFRPGCRRWPPACSAISATIRSA